MTTTCKSTQLRATILGILLLTLCIPAQATTEAQWDQNGKFLRDGGGGYYMPLGDLPSPVYGSAAAESALFDTITNNQCVHHDAYTVVREGSLTKFPKSFQYKMSLIYDIFRCADNAGIGSGHLTYKATSVSCPDGTDPDQNDECPVDCEDTEDETKTLNFDTLTLEQRDFVPPESIVTLSGCTYIKGGVSVWFPNQDGTYDGIQGYIGTGQKEDGEPDAALSDGSVPPPNTINETYETESSSESTTNSPTTTATNPDGSITEIYEVIEYKDGRDSVQVTGQGNGGVLKFADYSGYETVTTTTTTITTNTDGSTTTNITQNTINTTPAISTTTADANASSDNTVTSGQDGGETTNTTTTTTIETDENGEQTSSESETTSDGPPGEGEGEGDGCPDDDPLCFGPLNVSTPGQSIPGTTIDMPTVSGDGQAIAASCPIDKTVSVLGTDITIKMQPFCTMAGIVKPFILAAAWLIAALLVGRGIGS